MTRSKRIDLAAEARTIKPRIEKGGELLFDMEQRGEIGVDYQKWLTNFTRMVQDYDALTKSMILDGKRFIEVA